jgi:hypothetical protein
VFEEHGSFEALKDEYMQAWLHTGQQLQLEGQPSQVGHRYTLGVSWCALQWAVPQALVNAQRTCSMDTVTIRSMMYFARRQVPRYLAATSAMTRSFQFVWKQKRKRHAEQGKTTRKRRSMLEN